LLKASISFALELLENESKFLNEASDGFAKSMKSKQENKVGQLNLQHGIIKDAKERKKLKHSQTQMIQEHKILKEADIGPDAS